MIESLERLYESVKSFPKSSGVYIMRNETGRIIYVGKAKVLKKRVSDYFLKFQSDKTNALLSHVNSIDYIITSNEYEALILENNLIKKHKPHYNIDLKDDKTYSMVKITNEEFPKAYKTRRKKEDGGKYFGPYPKTDDLNIFMQIIEESFRYRRCKRLVKRDRPCLYYHIEKCPGPCFQPCDALEYKREMVRIERFLNGDFDDIRLQTEKRMKNFSKRLEFESALAEKRKLDVMQNFQSLQAVGNISGSKSADYIGSYKKDDMVFIYIMQYRNSDLLGAAGYWTKTPGDEEDVFFDFLMQYYTTCEEVPDRIEFSGEYDRRLLSEYFSKNLKSVEVCDARSKKDYRILELAKLNAKESYEKYMRKKKKDDRAVSFEYERFDYEANAPSADAFVISDDKTSRESFKSVLKSFSGIGEKRADSIAAVYASMEDLLSDSANGICAKTGISMRLADKIKNQLTI